MNVVTKVALLKMDFLGIANLTILGQAVRMVNETAWDAIDLSKLSLDDPMVFRLIGAGRTANVFQLERLGCDTELQPTTFDDLAAMVALAAKCSTEKLIAAAAECRHFGIRLRGAGRRPF